MKNMNSRQNKRLDDLQLNGLMIYQDPEAFCFGTDAVLLSSFAQARPGERVLDLGTGGGIIPILMSAKCEAEHFTGIEIQQASADLARESIALNGLQERIDIVCADVKDSPGIFKAGDYQVIVTNPPYIPLGKGICEESPRAIARHELKLTLAELTEAAGRLLLAKGRFYMVHRPERLIEAIDCMRQAHIEPKRLRFVHASAQKPASLILIEGMKEGRPYMKIEAPLILHDEEGNYTEEAAKIYGIAPDTEEK